MELQERETMLKPDELETDEGHDVWQTFIAASQGDVDALRHLIDKNPRLSRAEFWYTPAIHFAVREGHIDAVRLLLESGADPEKNGLYDGNLIQMARDRGLDQLPVCSNRNGIIVIAPSRSRRIPHFRKYSAAISTR